MSAVSATSASISGLVGHNGLVGCIVQNGLNGFIDLGVSFIGLGLVGFIGLGLVSIVGL